MGAIVVTCDGDRVLFSHEEAACIYAWTYIQDEVLQFRDAVMCTGYIPSEGSWVKVYESDELTGELFGLMLLHLSQLRGVITDHGDPNV